MAKTDLLRFATVGSVDDGKSTLIGRLLVDTKQLFDDQLDAVTEASIRRGTGEVDLSFVTDGLRAEREQGITIDVAYRYAATPTRKFVIADCPGHVQYTKNMATGASTADLALVVIDAQSGIKEQTRRHCCIAALLGVSEFVVCVNKMDLIDWDEAAFSKVAASVQDLATALGVRRVSVIPISALLGENVVRRGHNSEWFKGPTVLEALEAAHAGDWAGVGEDEGGTTTRLPVQWVIRQVGERRSYAGMFAGAPLRSGQSVVVLPLGKTTTVSKVETYDGPLDQAEAGISISVHLTDDFDVTRGDMIADVVHPPTVTSAIEATVCWFGAAPLKVGDRLRLKHTTHSTPARVTAIASVLQIDSLTLEPHDELGENQIGVVHLATATPLVVDPYAENRITGSFVLIDEKDNATVAAGLVGLPQILPHS